MGIGFFLLFAQETQTAVPVVPVHQGYDTGTVLIIGSIMSGFSIFATAMWQKYNEYIKVKADGKKTEAEAQAILDKAKAEAVAFIEKTKDELRQKERTDTNNEYRLIIAQIQKRNDVQEQENYNLHDKVSKITNDHLKCQEDNANLRREHQDLAHAFSLIKLEFDRFKLESGSHAYSDKKVETIVDVPGFVKEEPHEENTAAS